MRISSKKFLGTIVFVVICSYIAIGATPEGAVSNGAVLPEAAENTEERDSHTIDEALEARLPEDLSPRLLVKSIKISGNCLIATEKLLDGMPAIYNASGKPLEQAPSELLFDLRTTQEIINQPGEMREVSTRSIQGFTQYLLSIYQKRNYAGIYIYVPAETLRFGQGLPLGVLPIKVMEAHVGELSINRYDPNSVKVQRGYLRESALRSWSPAQSGRELNRKKLDDFVNLLNLNPDRYISAKISQGAEPNSLTVGYDIYEANPWHVFFQIDNSGTKDRQWTPRVGIINSNLLGFDDMFRFMYQAAWDSTFFEDYFIYGSYDFPILGPRLRATAFAGYSEFDVNPESGPINFIGAGTFYGGTLRFNVLQANRWFFDITGTLSHEESKVIPSLFPEYTRSDVKMNLLGWSVNLHHRDDMSSSAVTLEQFYNLGGSDNDEFTLARTNAERDFTIYSASAYHSQFLERNKVQRLSGTIRWTATDERLVPAKMTTLGGMYSVRGYDEYEIVADEALLVSAQYEFDLVAYLRAQKEREAEAETGKKPFLRKLAPLAFVDYGRGRIKDSLSSEDTDRELFSVGLGGTVELGDNFSGVVYYGFPLIATEDTRKCKGRVNAGLMLRW